MKFRVSRKNGMDSVIARVCQIMEYYQIRDNSCPYLLILTRLVHHAAYLMSVVSRACTNRVIYGTMSAS